MPKNKLILIGGGGHCESCIDVIEQENKFEIIGILDKKELVGTSILGYDVIGTDDEIMNLRKKNYSFLITVGQIKSAKLRLRIFLQLKELNASIATIISPLAYISKSAHIGKGTIIMHGVIVNTGVSIAENNVLNSGCILEHNTDIGSHCHISTQTVINGGCKIEDEVFVGSGTVILNQIKVCGGTIIGAGTVVNKNISIAGTYIGNPARMIGK